MLLEQINSRFVVFSEALECQLALKGQEYQFSQIRDLLAINKNEKHKGLYFVDFFIEMYFQFFFSFKMELSHVIGICERQNFKVFDINNNFINFQFDTIPITVLKLSSMDFSSIANILVRL